jgi:hypothetical protein
LFSGAPTFDAIGKVAGQPASTAPRDPATLLAMKPVFFETPADFREWLGKNHATAKELLVGFYKKGSKRPSITWPESVDEALCYGWIDGVRKGIDDQSYTIRFTPRRSGGIWSTVNVNRVQVLSDLGRMRTAGRRAFESRKEGKTGTHPRRCPARLARSIRRSPFMRGRPRCPARLGADIRAATASACLPAAATVV